MLRRWITTTMLACLAHAQSQPQAEGWLRAFLDRVPTDACAVAAVEMPATDLGKMVLSALGPEWGEVADTAIKKKKAPFRDLADLVSKVALPLADRCGVVVHGLRLDPDRTVVDAAPVPELACVFWLRAGADAAPLQQLLQIAISTQFVGLARKMFVLDLTGGAKVLEVVNPMIPGTGTIAIGLSERVFVIGNSAALAKQLIDVPVAGGGNFGKRMNRLVLDDPGTGRGSLLWRPEGVEAVLADWAAYVEKQAVAASAGSRPETDANPVLQARQLLQLFPFAQAQVQFEQKTVPLVLARVLGS